MCFKFCVQREIDKAQQVAVEFHECWHDSVVNISWMLKQQKTTCLKDALSDTAFKKL